MKIKAAAQGPVVLYDSRGAIKDERRKWSNDEWTRSTLLFGMLRRGDHGNTDLYLSDVDHLHLIPRSAMLALRDAGMVRLDGDRWTLTESGARAAKAALREEILESLFLDKDHAVSSKAVENREDNAMLAVLRSEKRVERRAGLWRATAAGLKEGKAAHRRRMAAGWPEPEPEFIEIDLLG